MNIDLLIEDLNKVKAGWEDGNSDEAFDLLGNIISELEIYNEPELLPCGHDIKYLGAFGGTNPKGSCLMCEELKRGDI